MRKLVAKMLFAGAAAAAAIGLGASSASAATFTVTGGGTFTGSAGATTLVVRHGSNNVTLRCTSSRASGSAANGTGLSGTGIARITAISFTSCTLGGILSFTVTPSNLPWSINAVSFDGSDVTTGTISGIHVGISGTGCTASVDGSAQNAHDGTVNATYRNSTAVLATNGTGTLHVFGVSGCLGLIGNGDTAGFTSSYSLSPATLHIVSP